MVFPGLLESGFMISVGVSLLLAGLIVYYVRGQLSQLTNQLSNQQTVLSQFIENIKESTTALVRGEPSTEPARQKTCASEIPIRIQTEAAFSDVASEASTEEDEPANQAGTMSLSVTNLDDLYNGCPRESATTVTVDELVGKGDETPIIPQDLKKAKVGELRELAESTLSWDAADIKKAKKAELIEALTQDTN